MISNRFKKLQAVLVFAALSLLVPKVPSSGKFLPKSDFRCSNNAFAQSQWWRASELSPEAEDFEDAHEEEIESLELLSASIPVEGFTQPFKLGCPVSFLFRFSGQLHFLNIPPPVLA